MGFSLKNAKCCYILSYFRLLDPKKEEMAEQVALATREWNIFLVFNNITKQLYE